MIQDRVRICFKPVIWRYYS